eukprot:gene4899-5981_t
MPSEQIEEHIEECNAKGLNSKDSAAVQGEVILEACPIQLPLVRSGCREICAVGDQAGLRQNWEAANITLQKKQGKIEGIWEGQG